jgi:hypothetical protein
MQRDSFVGAASPARGCTRSITSGDTLIDATADDNVKGAGSKRDIVDGRLHLRGAPLPHRLSRRQHDPNACRLRGRPRERTIFPSFVRS